MMDLSHAIESHINWQMKFRRAITNRDQMDVAIIARDNCCELGIWLRGEGKAKYGHLRNYTDCVRRHNEFHTQAASVAGAINEKNIAKSTILSAGTAYPSTSNAVCVATSLIKAEAGI